MKKLVTAFSLLAILSSGVMVASAQSMGGGASSNSCVYLTSSQSLGSSDATTGGQVSILQRFLINKGFLSTSTGNPTGYYGAQTVAAVKAYQASVGVNLTGTVGPLTRLAIARDTGCVQALTGVNVKDKDIKYCMDDSTYNAATGACIPKVNCTTSSASSACNTTTTYVCNGVVSTTPCTVVTTTSSTPTITGVSPTFGSGGTTFTINGTGFTATGNYLFLDYVPTSNSKYVIGGNLSLINNNIMFTLPAQYPCPTYTNGGVGCPAPQNISAGTHTLTVYNANGTSNSISFTVNSGIPTISSFTAAPTIISSGQSTVLTWAADSRFGCTLKNVTTGNIETTSASSQSKTVSPTQTTTYKLMCSTPDYIPSSSGQGVPTYTDEKIVTVTVNGSGRCNSEQTLINGVCTNNTRTYTCPNGTVITIPILVNPTPSMCPSTSSAPSIEFVGTPTLALQYDSAGKESLLVGKAKIKLTTGNAAITVRTYTIGAILPFFIGNESKSANSVSYSASCVGANLDLNTVSTLSANSTYVCDITNTIKTSQLFAGTYTLKPSNFIYNNDSTNYGEIPASRYINSALSNSVTIVGETSPYIASAVVNTNGTITLTGQRLNLANNMLVIDGGGNSMVSKFNGSASTFTFPTSPYNLVAGGHFIQINNSTTGNSNTYYVVTTAPATTSSAPTVEFIGSPTLTLMYDSAGRESYLLGKVNVKITTGNASIGLYERSVPGMMQFNRGGGAIYTNNTKFEVAPSPTTIPANTTQTFLIADSVPTKELYSGTYTFAPANFSYINSNATSYETVQYTAFKNAATSNAVTVVGETAPYINSASYQTAQGGIGVIILQGIRFGSEDNVTIGNITKTVPAANGTMLTLTASDFGITSSGAYTVQISNGEGASNRVAVNVAITPNTTVAKPVITLTANGASVTNGGKIQAVNGQVTLMWSVTGGATCTLNGTSVTSSGTQTLSNLSNGSYTYSCVNGGGTTALVFSVEVPITSYTTPTTGKKPVLTLKINNNNVNDNERVTVPSGVATIVWGGTGADKCYLGELEVSTTGSQVLSDIGTASYTFRCTNGAGASSISFTVIRTNGTAAPSVIAKPVITIKANGSRVNNGDTINLPKGTLTVVWGAPGADGCSLNGTAFPASGTRSYSGLSTADYTFECTNSGGTTKIQFKVVVPSVLGVSTACVDLPYNFHRGNESVSVKNLQSFLIAKGYMDGEVTGFYGDKTVEAVKDYQGAKGLPVTGMVYDFTRSAIKAESCQ